MDLRRSQRIAGTLRNELEEIVNYELEDPRIGMVTIEEVILSPDGRQALARTTLSGHASDQQIALAALSGASGIIRRLLAERLIVYRCPEIHFESAVPIDSVEKTSRLLRRVRRGRPRQ